MNQHLSHSAFQIFNDVSRDDIFCCFFKNTSLCPAPPGMHQKIALIFGDGACRARICFSRRVCYTIYK